MQHLLVTVLLVAVGYTSAQTICNGVTIYSRDDWGARAPNCQTSMPLPVTYVFIHHTVTPECFNFEDCAQEMRDIQDFHMDGNGWCDIGYNFLIGGDGAVYEGRGWDRVGAHTPPYNDLSVAFSLIGNFDVEPAPTNMLETAEALIGCATDVVGAVEDLYSLHGHRDTTCTACPGQYVYDEISDWLYFNRLEVIYDC